MKVEGSLPIDVVAAVINRDNRYLVCQRPHHKKHGGLWEFPGGKCEGQESFAETISRELFEEIRVNVVGVGRVLFSAIDPEGAFTINFQEVVISGDPVALEHSDLRWLSIEEMDSIELAPTDLLFTRFLTQQRSL